MAVKNFKLITDAIHGRKPDHKNLLLSRIGKTVKSKILGYMVSFSQHNIIHVHHKQEDPPSILKQWVEFPNLGKFGNNHNNIITEFSYWIRVS